MKWLNRRRAAGLIAVGTAAVLGLATGGPVTQAAPAKPKPTHTQIQLLAINDFHGNLEAPGGSGGNINGVPAGGAAFLATHLKQMREAVKAERELSYMEPPYWHYAAKLSLGAALLKAGKAAEAEALFRETLKRDLPANGWPLFGLEQSLRAQGKEAEAQQVAKEFKKAWKHADTKLDLAWF